MLKWKYNTQMKRPPPMEIKFGRSNGSNNGLLCVQRNRYQMLPKYTMPRRTTQKCWIAHLEVNVRASGHKLAQTIEHLQVVVLPDLKAIC